MIYGVTVTSGRHLELGVCPLLISHRCACLRRDHVEIFQHITHEQCRPLTERMELIRKCQHLLYEPRPLTDTVCLCKAGVLGAVIIFKVKVMRDFIRVFSSVYSASYGSVTFTARFFPSHYAQK